MSDTWSSTRASINRLKKTLAEADEDTRWDFGIWAAGLLMMAVAIITQFGGLGFLFCVGWLAWVSAEHALRN